MPFLRYLWEACRRKLHKQSKTPSSQPVVLTTETQGTRHATAADLNFGLMPRQTSLFLSLLPPELRNIIYAYALTELDGRGPLITPDLKPPGLLATCSQIRRETHEMWYDSNQFIIDIQNFDGSLFVKWNRHCGVPGQEPGLADLDVRFSFSGHPSWAMLRDWIRVLWEADKSVLILRDRGVDTTCAYWRPVVAAHELLHVYDGSPWEQLEASLDSMRFAVSGFIDAWR